MIHTGVAKLWDSEGWKGVRRRGSHGLCAPLRFNRCYAILGSRVRTDIWPDETTLSSRKFIVDVEATLRSLLAREDTDSNMQITIEDDGPKVGRSLSIHPQLLASGGWLTWREDRFSPWGRPPRAASVALMSAAPTCSRTCCKS